MEGLLGDKEQWFSMFLGFAPIEYVNEISKEVGQNGKAYNLVMSLRFNVIERLGRSYNEGDVG